MIKKKIAFIFPGQGAQYVGMAKDFYQQFADVRELFEEADDRLSRKLSTLILEGPETSLTETKNSQPAIYVTCLAMWKVLKKLFPFLSPYSCAGLSLGEYTALTVAEKLPFDVGLSLVNKRSQFMNEACEANPGTMAVILGLEGASVEKMVQELNLPRDLWVANYNCPGQVVIAGTLKGIEKGTAAAKLKGAKRILPLQVHGAFHSGLMRMAEEKLAPYLIDLSLKESPTLCMMNVTGEFAQTEDEMRQNLIKQVTHSVYWEKGIQAMAKGVELFVEVGCGKTLAAFNKRMDLAIPTLSIETLQDLDLLAKEIT